MRWPSASLNGLYGRPGSVSPSLEHLTMRVIATDSTRFSGVRQSMAGGIQTAGNQRACCAVDLAMARAMAHPTCRCRGVAHDPLAPIVLSQVKALTHGTVDLGAPKSGLRRHGDRPGVLRDRARRRDRASDRPVAVRHPRP